MVFLCLICGFFVCGSLWFLRRVSGLFFKEEESVGGGGKDSGASFWFFYWFARIVAVPSVRGVGLFFCSGECLGSLAERSVASLAFGPRSRKCGKRSQK